MKKSLGKTGFFQAVGHDGLVRKKNNFKNKTIKLFFEKKYLKIKSWTNIEG